MEPVRILTEQLMALARDAVALTPQLLIAVAILVVTFFISQLVQKITSKVMPTRRLRASLRSLFINLAAVVSWAAGITLAAVVLFPGLTPASVLAGLGIGSVAIGFAFKDIFENFLAGVIILFRKEMRIDDYIECAGLEGAVESISIRETHIRQTDGQLVIAPNAMLFKNPLTIRTDLTLRRLSIFCGVAYKENVEEAREVIHRAVERCDTVKRELHHVEVFASQFGSSSIDFEVTWWTGSTPCAQRKSRDEVIAAVKGALDDAGIEIPFPYRTLTFSEPLSVESYQYEDTQSHSTDKNDL